MTMTQVWGPRAGEFAAGYAVSGVHQPINSEQVASLRQRLLAGFERKDGGSAIQSRKHIQDLASRKVGVVRNEEGLKQALQEIPALHEEISNVSLTCRDKVFNMEWVQAIQNENMITVLEMVARASLMRTESRGALYRLDYPKVDNVGWAKHIVISQENGQMTLTLVPVNMSIREPRRELKTYGVKE